MQAHKFIKYPEDHKIGKIVRKWRNIRNVTQKELAKNIGVSYQQLQKYETGQNRLSIGRLIQISKNLDVPLTDFFMELNYQSNSPSVFGNVLENPEGLQLLLKMKKLSPATQKKIGELVDTLLADKFEDY